MRYIQGPGEIENLQKHSAEYAVFSVFSVNNGSESYLLGHGGQ